MTEDRSESRITVGAVASLHRYPVKSMCGEGLASAVVTARGIAGDRAWALLDSATGKVASAKRPQFWRNLLACRARTIREPNGGAPDVEIGFPDGATCRATDPAAGERLTTLLGRAVTLSHEPPARSTIDRSFPDEVLAAGLDAEVEGIELELGQGVPSGTFLDFAPLHLLTSATLASLGAAMPDGQVAPGRYRPNVIVESVPGQPAFPENGWLGGCLRIGPDVVIRVVMPTPRCAIPTLAQGALPADPQALRVTARLNTRPVEGFGDLPCAGLYASVVQPGRIRTGDTVMWLG